MDASQNACRQGVNVHQSRSRLAAAAPTVSAPGRYTRRPPGRAATFAGSLALAAVCAAVLAAGSGDWQDPPQEQQPPIFRIDTNFVRVDVYPTRDGRPVIGLRAEDFDVFEDGVPQRIETFEHVLITPAGPQANRREPSSQREALQEVANPRSRVFVIFLDTPNVSVEGSHHIKEPLIRLIDQIVGPDDLVGVMTPAMSTTEIVFGRKTLVIEESLRRNWAWGTRFSVMLDEREAAYERCYPPTGSEAGLGRSRLAEELIRRKRERATLEAFQDLVRFLQAVREERKAILAVSEGWLLMRENPQLLNVRKGEPIPGNEPIRVSPTGKLTTRDDRNPGSLTTTECDADRMRLAMMDNDRFLRDIIDDANRGNASFYPIDPRGFVVFDNPMGPAPPPPLQVDRAMLKARHDAMQTLAGATDGLAVLHSNDLDKGLRRIVDDLTSYYLLGYYSTNTRLDGRFRQLRVRVKQPGVDVRARRGYRAPTEEEVAAARRAAEPPAASSSSTFTAAMGSLARIRPDARFHINATASPPGEGRRTLWVAGELQQIAGRYEEFQLGGTALIEATGAGSTSTARATLGSGERAFLTAMEMPPGVSGQIDVRVRLIGEGGGIPLIDAVQVDVGPSVAQPLLFRRGPSTGNRVLPAADFRFRRTDRVRLEVPVLPGVEPGDGRVLDKAGQPLRVPISIAARADETGQHWMTAELVLAPLAPGDYAIEIGTISESTQQRVVTAIRVTR